jgi:hypothetical protein
MSSLLRIRLMGVLLLRAEAPLVAEPGGRETFRA